MNCLCKYVRWGTYERYILWLRTKVTWYTAQNNCVGSKISTPPRALDVTRVYTLSLPNSSLKDLPKLEVLICLINYSVEP